MFLNDDLWVEEADFAAAFQRLREHVVSGASRQFLNSTAGLNLTPVAARRRPLNFYRSFELVEIKLDLDALGLEKTFDRACLYALEGRQEAWLLTGEREVIYQVNDLQRIVHRHRRRELDLTTTEQYRDYLRFFCSFIYGATMSTFPFMENWQDILWPRPQDLERDVLVSFDALVEERRKERGWPSEPLELDVEDLRQFLQDKRTALRSFRLKLRENKAWRSNLGLSSARYLWAQPVDVAFSQVPDEHFAAEGTVQFEDTLFRAQLTVRREGRVEFKDDKPVQDAPAPGWVFHPNLPLMLLAKLRTRMDAEEFQRQLISEGEARAAQQPEPSRARNTNLRVKGNVDLSSLTLSHAVVMEDIEIDGDLILEGATLTTVVLKDVKIVGCLRAAYLTCKGSFLAQSLRVEGVHDRYNVQVAGTERLKAAVSLRSAKLESDFVMSPASLTGGLDMSEAEVKGQASLEGLKILSRMPLERDYGCMLMGSRFHRGLSLAPTPKPVKMAFGSGKQETEIVGPLNGEQMFVGGSLDLTGLQLRFPQEGTVIEPAALTQGYLSAIEQATARFDADIVRFQYDSRIGEVVQLGYRIVERPDQTRDDHLGILRLKQAEIGNELSAGTVVVEGDVVADNLKMGGSVVLFLGEVGAPVLGDAGTVKAPFSEGETRYSRAGSVFLGSGSMQHVQMVRCQIHGELNLWNTRVRGEFDARGIRVDGSIIAHGAQFSERCHLSPYEGYRTEVGNPGTVALQFNGATSKYIGLSGALIRGSADFSFSIIDGILDGESVGRFCTEIGGDLLLSGAQVNSDLRFTAARIGGAVDAITGSFHRLQFRPGWVESEAKPTKVGAVRFLHCSANDVDFFALQVRAGLSKRGVSGGIVFADVKIAANLLFSKDSLDYLYYGLDAKHALHGKRLDPRDYPCNIEAVLELDSVTVGGDVDLRGINVGRAVKIKQLTVGGDLLGDRLRGPVPCCQKSPLPSLEMTRTRVTGDCRMTDLGLPLVKLERSTYDGQFEVNLDAVGVRPRLHLDGCHLRHLVYDSAAMDCAKLTLIKSEIENLEFRSGLPAMQLENTRIARWLFGKGADHSDGRAESLRKVLNSSTPYDTDNYVRISKSLRESGDLKGADAVYVDMRWRAVTEPHNFGGRDQYWRPKGREKFAILRKHPVDPLLGWFTGFWTAGYRPLAFILPITLLMSLWIVQAPENVEPTSEKREERASNAESAMIEPAQPKVWTPIEKAELLVTYHLPMFSAAATPRWELAEERPLVLRLPKFLTISPTAKRPEIHDPTLLPAAANASTSAVKLPVSPATYGVIVRLLHWIAWPLALAGVIVTMQRRRSIE